MHLAHCQKALRRRHRGLLVAGPCARAVWPVVRAADGDGDGVTLLMCHGSLGQALLCTAPAVADVVLGWDERSGVAQDVGGAL